MKKRKLSEAILKLLGTRKAVPLPELHAELSDDQKSKYAVTRTVKNMEEGGLAEVWESHRQPYVRLTKEGRQKLMTLNLNNTEVPIPQAWDGFWRIVLLDIPEARRSEREALRYLLKKAGFVCLKNSAWISPYPLEHLFSNLKKDFGLSTEMMIMKTDSMDEETTKHLYKLFGFV